jgi:hypothetical protein
LKTLESSGFRARGEAICTAQVVKIDPKSCNLTIRQLSLI